MALTNHSEKDRPVPEEKNKRNGNNKKPAVKPGSDHEKFSPGEPDNYDAEEFATD